MAVSNATVQIVRIKLQVLKKELDEINVRIDRQSAIVTEEQSQLTKLKAIKDAIVVERNSLKTDIGD